MKIEDEINQPRFNSPQHKAIINIIYTANAIQDVLKESLKPFQISLPQYNVLRILKGRNDGFATCGDLKEVMLDKNPDVTRLCDKLVEKKLILRSNNKSNRRQIHLRISEKGLDLLKQLEPIVNHVSIDEKSISDQSLDQLSDLLDLIRDQISPNLK